MSATDPKNLQESRVWKVNLRQGLQNQQKKLDPEEDISPQTQWKNEKLDPESEESF